MFPNMVCILRWWDNVHSPLGALGTRASLPLSAQWEVYSQQECNRSKGLNSQHAPAVETSEARQEWSDDNSAGSVSFPFGANLRLETDTAVTLLAFCLPLTWQPWCSGRAQAAAPT